MEPVTVRPGCLRPEPTHSSRCVPLHVCVNTRSCATCRPPSFPVVGVGGYGCEGVTKVGEMPQEHQAMCHSPLWQTGKSCGLLPQTVFSTS